MSESEYYESVVHWDLGQHLDNEEQLSRFQVTEALISPQAKRLLDAGTGNGAFLSYLEKRSKPLDLRGLERSKSAIAASQCRTEITEGSIDALPFADRSFDTVTALEVIEHLPHAVYPKALAEMARVSASQVIISVPYRERRLMVTCPECACQFSPIFHLRTFDDDTMTGLVPGFRLTAHEYVATQVNWVVTDLADKFRRMRERRRGVAPIPAICPQCGYSMPSSQPGRSSAQSPGASAVPGLRSRLLSWVPKVSRAYWVVASYERLS